mgnify:FL=1
MKFSFITQLPPESDVCPVYLSGEEEVILGLSPVLRLHVALAQILVHVVPKRALNLLTALARGEYRALSDLDKHIPRRRLLVLRHQPEAGAVEIQEPGLLGLPRLRLNLKRIQSQNCFTIFLNHFTCSFSESVSLLDSFRAQIFSILNE